VQVPFFPHDYQPKGLFAMLIHREIVISRKNLKDRTYTPQQVTDKELGELSPQDRDVFSRPAVELLYSIYKEGGFCQDEDLQKGSNIRKI